MRRELGWFLAGMMVTGPVAWAASAVLARVGGEVISAEELVERGRGMNPEAGALLSEGQKEALLDRMIAEELIYREALKQGYAEHPMVRRTMVDTLLKEKVYAEIAAQEISEAEQQSYYDAHRAEFTIPERREVRVLRVGTKKLANDLRRQIEKDPKQFGPLARQSSEDPSKKKGGDLGYLMAGQRSSLGPDLLAAAFALEPGKVSQVIETPEGGFVLLLVTDVRPPEERTLEESRAMVIRAIRAERRDAALAAYTEQLRKGTQVTEDPAALRALQVPGREAGQGRGGEREGDEGEGEGGGGEGEPIHLRGGK